MIAYFLSSNLRFFYGFMDVGCVKLGTIQGMPYIIDGHNLIPKIPGMSLADLDDEQQLILLLQDYCRMQRKQVEVYFDQAPPGQPASARYGAVTAHYVRRGTPADVAIQRRLTRLGKGASNWTVVSSDQAVQRAARELRAQALSAEAFARSLAQVLAGNGKDVAENRSPDLAPDEVEAWLKLFGGKADKR
jgi:uncharacterized protein